MFEPARYNLAVRQGKTLPGFSLRMWFDGELAEIVAMRIQVRDFRGRLVTSWSTADASIEVEDERRIVTSKTPEQTALFPVGIHRLAIELTFEGGVSMDFIAGSLHVAPSPTK